MAFKKNNLFGFLIFFSFSGILMAQERNISGTVTGADDELPIPGVNVVIKGTNQGAVTNVYGQYSIDVESEDDVLVFVFLEYKTTKIKVGNQGEINVKMEVDGKSQEETVKIGYTGGQKVSYGLSSLGDEKARKSVEELLDLDLKKNGMLEKCVL